MKYTKKYPIHTKPEKQFSGASIFADGGTFKSYNPDLAQKDKDFQNWYNKNTLEGQNQIPYSNSLDYDYYSFFKNNGVGNIQNHFPDTYKRPNHPTFSNESIYSTPENPGGSWQGESYNPKGKFLFADGGPKTKTYTNKAEYDKTLQDNLKTNFNIPQYLTSEQKTWMKENPHAEREQELRNYYNEPTGNDKYYRDYAKMSDNYNRQPTSEKLKDAAIEFGIGMAPEILPFLKLKNLKSAIDIGKKSGEFVKDATTYGVNKFLVDTKVGNKILDNTVARNANKEIKAGQDWVDNWYSQPTTKSKFDDVKKLNEEYSNQKAPGYKGLTNGMVEDFQKLYEKKLSKETGKLINISKGANKKNYSFYLGKNKPDIESSVSSDVFTDNTSNWGISLGENNTAYVNKLAKNQKSVSAHERTHQYFKEGDYTDFDTKFLRSPYNTDFDAISASRNRYLKKPQEIHARMNEMRMDLGLNPEDTFTSEMIDKIKVKTPGIQEMLKNIKDKEQFAKVMNSFYSGTGITIGANYFNKDNESMKKYKSTGQKFAFGGFKYPNGGSFYNASNLNTSKPQVNTVPSSYTEQFSGNSSSGMTKDGKLPGSTPNVRSTSNYQQTANAITQYGTAAANIAGEITSSTLDTSYKNPESDKFAAVDTTMSNIPVIGQFYQLGNAANEPIKDWQADATKREGAKSSEAVTATALSGAIDPMDGWKQNVAAYEAGNISKDEAIGNLVAQFFLPGFANQSVNQANEEARKKKQLNTSLLNAQNVDSASRNFSAFGGYKNKFPYGGHVNTFNLAQMAYGGNMKSEVTGKSYLKDQISDLNQPGFQSHASGGVTIGNNEMEKPEVIWEDKVFSYQLKDKDGIPYSDRARKLIKQIKK